MDSKDKSKWLLVVILAVVFVSITIYCFSNTQPIIKANTGEAVVRFSNTPAATRANVLKADTYSSALEPQQRALVGLKGVQVCVNKFRTDEESYGLSKQRLQIDVELRLRQNGIKVLSQGDAVLSIDVLYQTSVYKDFTKADIIANSIIVQLYEPVRLERGFQIPCRAAVWRLLMINAIPTKYFADMVRQGVNDAIDSFINDYLAANPK